MSLTVAELLMGAGYVPGRSGVLPSVTSQPCIPGRVCPLFRLIYRVLFFQPPTGIYGESHHSPHPWEAERRQGSLVAKGVGWGGVGNRGILNSKSTVLHPRPGLHP